MRPGRTVGGTVTIRNSGDAAAALTLSKSDLVDSPGSGGGRLSEALFLAVDDFAAQRRVYDGPIASMERVPLAPIAARGANGFRFTVTMPRTRDDRYQAASASVRFDWAATALPSGPSGGGGGGTVKPPPDRRAPRLTLSGKRSQHAGKRGLVLYARCDEPCTLGATARVSGVKGVRRASAKAGALRASGSRRVAIRITFPRKALRRLRRPGRHAAVTVTVTARDAAGNRSRAKRRIKLRGAYRPGFRRPPLSIFTSR